jgi:hypothetical protein
MLFYTASRPQVRIATAVYDNIVEVLCWHRSIYMHRRTFRLVVERLTQFHAPWKYFWSSAICGHSLKSMDQASMFFTRQS